MLCLPYKHQHRFHTFEAKQDDTIMALDVAYKMWETKMMVEFVVRNANGTEERILAHKGMLEKVRYSLYEEEMKPIYITVASAEAFKEYLAMLYGHIGALTEENLTQVCVLMQKYNDCDDE